MAWTIHGLLLSEPTSSHFASNSLSLLSKGMLSRNRKILLFLTLAGVVALAIFAPAPDESAGQRTSAGAVRASGSSSTAPLVPEQAKTMRRGELLSEFPERNILGDAKGDPFDSKSWQPPPPKVVVTPAGPPPPPPMTYRFAGRLRQDGKLQIFVSNGDIPVVARVGGNLDGYVIESMTASSIALVYPPTGNKDSIVIPPEVLGEGSLTIPSASAATPRTAPGPLPGQMTGGSPQSTPAQPAPATPVRQPVNK